MEKIKKIMPSIIFGFFIVVLSFFFFLGDISFSPELSHVDIPETQSIDLHNLNIDAVVDRNNNISVTETFDVTFLQSGLSEVIRFIPYATHTYRFIEGKVVKDVLYAKIDKASGKGEMGERFNTYIDEERGYLTFGLRERRYYKKGETRSFSISYVYRMGNDKNKGFDDVYFNIVGVNSLLTIRNVSFQISLPSEIENPERITVYKGAAGGTATMDVDISGNLITGNIDKLEPTEGITFRAVFEDGYLYKTLSVSTVHVVCLTLAIGALGISLLCFFVLRQRKNYPVPVEVAPFEGLDPYNADYFDNAAISEKSISATVIYLANGGYIKIEAEGKDDFILRKTDKDIATQNSNAAKGIYEALFKEEDEIKISDVDEKFAKATWEIKSAEKAFNQKKLYNAKKKGVLVCKAAVILLSFIIGILTLSTLPRAFFGHRTGALFAFKPVFFAIIGFGAFLCYIKKNYVLNIISTALMAMYLSFLYFKFGFNTFDTCYLCYVSMLLIAPLPMLLSIEPKYSKEGMHFKGRVLGFKRYIEKCEVSQIKLFAEENPSYYFDVLPYAYVFNLSDVWINKFKGLEIQVPDWFISNNVTLGDILVFNMFYTRFNSSMSKSISDARTQYFASHSSSSFKGGSSFGGSSFGGGGFSGGGGGGGGFGAR